MRHPLATLADHLDARRAVPLAWILTHAPNGDLQPLWDTCPYPWPLIALLRALADERHVTAALNATIAFDCHQSWPRTDTDETTALALAARAVRFVVPNAPSLRALVAVAEAHRQDRQGVA